MISGIALLTSLLFSAQPSLVGSPDTTVPAETTALIERLRLPVPTDTPYAEVRFVHGLRKPLQLRGELHYGGAGVLGKRVDEPYRETMMIANGEVEVQRDGKPVRKFSLERAPELGALLSGFGALLSGDATELNHHFAITFAGSQADWRLILAPRARELADHLRDLIVDGGHDGVHCISIRETDGDSSVMRLGAFANFKLPDSPTYASLEARCKPTLPQY